MQLSNPNKEDCIRDIDDSVNYYETQIGFRSIEKPKNPEDIIHKLLSGHNIDKDSTVSPNVVSETGTGKNNIVLRSSRVRSVVPNKKYAGQDWTV